MSTKPAAEPKREDHLEKFFSQADGRQRPAVDAGPKAAPRGYTVVGERASARRDLFDDIVESLDRPEGEAAGLPAKAAPSGVRAVREEWQQAYEQVEKRSPEKSPWPVLFTAAKFVMTWGSVAIAVVALIVVVALGVSTGARWTLERRERQAQAARELQDKWDTFLRAGWRQSEKVDSIKSLDVQRSEVAYLKELGPDRGRVHLKVVTTDGNRAYQLSGWVPDAGTRARALEEIRSVFPDARPDIDTVRVRSSGRLESGEVRIINLEPRFTPDGRLVDRLQYGESGFSSPMPQDGRSKSPIPQNTVLGDAPPAGSKYFYVIGGGGKYWQIPAQRQQLIEAAFRRLAEAPDKGAGAVAVLLVYFDGEQPLVETIKFDPSAPRITSFTASPSEIKQGQSATLQWSTSDSGGVTIDGGRETPASTTYKLSATGPDGRPSESSVTVTAEPPPTGKRQP